MMSAAMLCREWGCMCGSFTTLEHISFKKIDEISIFIFITKRLFTAYTKAQW